MSTSYAYPRSSSSILLCRFLVCESSRLVTSFASDGNLHGYLTAAAQDASSGLAVASFQLHDRVPRRLTKHQGSFS